MKSLRFRLTKDLYDKDVVMKTAYLFSDTYYIDIDSTEKDYSVLIQSMHGDIDPSIIKSFKNTLLSQCVRKIVAKETANLRELIFARAMYTATLEKADIPLQDYKVDVKQIETNLDSIAIDWFENDI